MTKRLKYAGKHLDTDVFERRFESSGQFIYWLSMKNNACFVTASILQKHYYNVWASPCKQTKSHKEPCIVKKNFQKERHLVVKNAFTFAKV